MVDRPEGPTLTKTYGQKKIKKSVPGYGRRVKWDRRGEGEMEIGVSV